MRQEAAEAKERTERARKMAAEIEAKRRQEEAEQRAAAAKLALEEKRKREQELRAMRSLEALSRKQAKPTAPQPTTAQVVTPLEGIELLAKNKEAKIRKLTPNESINEIANGRDPKGLWVIETRAANSGVGAPPVHPAIPPSRVATPTNPTGLTNPPGRAVTIPAAPPVIAAPTLQPSHAQVSVPGPSNVTAPAPTTPSTPTTSPSQSSGRVASTSPASTRPQPSAPSPTSRNNSPTPIQSPSTFSASSQKPPIEQFFSQRTNGSTSATLPPKAPDPVKNLWNGMERIVQGNNAFLKSRPGQLITETLGAAGGPYTGNAMPTAKLALTTGSTAALAVETFQKRDWLGGLQKGADKVATSATGLLGAAATPWNPTLGASVAAGTTQFVLSSYRLYGAPVVGDWLVNTFPDTFIPAQSQQ